MLLPGVTGLGGIGSAGATPWEMFGVKLEHHCESHLKPTPCASPGLPRAAAFVKSFGTCCKSMGAADVPQ